MMEHSASDSETEDHVQPLLRRKDTGEVQKGSRTLTMNAYYVFMQIYNMPRKKRAGTIRAIILVTYLQSNNTFENAVVIVVLN